MCMQRVRIFDCVFYKTIDVSAISSAVSVYIVKQLAQNHWLTHCCRDTMSSMQFAKCLANTKTTVQPQVCDEEPVARITRPGLLEQTPGFWYPKEVSIWDEGGQEVTFPQLKKMPTHPVSVTYYYGSPAWPTPHQRSTVSA